MLLLSHQFSASYSMVYLQAASTQFILYSTNEIYLGSEGNGLQVVTPMNI